jgi:uncharacterized protein (TIGR03435 family)
MIFARLRMVAMIFAILPAFAQNTGERLGFEVASVKPGLPPDVALQGRRGMRGGPGTTDPTRFVCENLTLWHLLRFAYNIDQQRISGSSWMQMMRYNIEARVPPGATRDQLKLMLQALLAERFKLAAHFEKKEMQIYELTVAKNGPKMKESNADPSVPPTTPPPPAVFMGRIGPDKRTMEELAQALSGFMGHPVIDKTGLKAKYDADLYYGGPDVFAGVPGSPPPRDPLDAGAAGRSDGPDFFDAVRMQLGLELKPKKALIDVLVVDHAEKVPTEN